MNRAMMGAILISVSLLCGSDFASANNYTKGSIRCDSFQDALEKYKLHPKGGYGVNYGLCLLARGEEDVKALVILEAEAAKNNVPAADLLAFYTATGGTMDKANIDENNYNEAFQAYGRVVFMIDQHPNYPTGLEMAEYKEQYELEAYFYLVYLSHLKFTNGLGGSHNYNLLQSPSYKGDRNLPLYPNYSPYTIYTAEQIIENAEICANLPKKKYFRSFLYNQTIQYCRMMKQFGQQILIAEEKRLALLNDRSCKGDIEQCAKYQNALKKMHTLYDTRNKEAHRIWQAK